MTTAADDIVLRRIAEQDGQLDWYRLDRKLSLQGIVLGGELIGVLQRLQSQGLIALEPSERPSLPRYVVTQEGWRRLGQG